MNFNKQRVFLLLSLLLLTTSCSGLEKNSTKNISQQTSPIIASEAREEDKARFNALYDQVTSNILDQIREMQGIANVDDSDENVQHLKNTLSVIINKLKDAFDAGEINPFAQIITEGIGVAPSTGRRLRIGYFPVAADPFHWAHLFTAFQVQAELKLDKIVFIVGGTDPRKPSLTPASIRHPMAKKALSLFGDFFAFSDITMHEGRNNPDNLEQLSSNGTNDGETNMFHDLKRNSNLAIDAYYMVGSDHFNWTVTTSSGEVRDDTLKKLTENMTKPNLGFEPGGNHTIRAAFIARYPGEITESKLSEMKELVNYEIAVVEPRLSYSSTQIRNALLGRGEEGKKPLIMLPAVTYQDIVHYGLYKN